MPNRPIALRPIQRRRRRAALGHMCPQCHRPWALTAGTDDTGFVVICRYCEYERPVELPRPRSAPAAEATGG